jgi:hypothetical protein
MNFFERLFGGGASNAAPAPSSRRGQRRVFTQ